jgi:pyruvate dehydrogenase E2 component (dihydrolipoamide acetyltransferase)
VEVDVDMGRAMAIVQDFRDGAAGGASAGPKVTVTALLVRACAWALAQFPAANSMFEADQIVEWDEVNIGVAIAIEQGLIVPVVHHADHLGMKEIAARLADLTARARENRLKLDDLQGGTFTISNLGMFGTDRFTAILNPPQAAILAVGRVAKRAMVGADDRIEVRQMASLALTADHRVLDGAAGAQFLALIQRALEHPGLLLG